MLSEGGPILPRRDTETARERPTQNLCAPKTASVGDLVKAQRRRFQLPPRSFEPDIFNVPRRRFADFLREDAGKVARAHGRATGERSNGKVAFGIVGHPAEQIAERLGFARLSGERRAEL